MLTVFAIIVKVAELYDLSAVQLIASDVSVELPDWVSVESSSVVEPMD